jgi:3-hydroxybutyryl-CoA dehydrogenase
MADERIAVVGAGLMGHGIAQVMAASGHRVAITDPDADVLASVPGRVRANLERLGADLAPADTIELCHELDEALAGADVVFEAASERLELKRNLFERISRVVSPDTILATNTSAISIGEIGALARDPGRAVGTHWWNPPYLVPLVEVVQADATRPETIERTIDLLERAGKSPVHVRKDIPGFVGNRMQHALWREAISIVAEGICDGEAIDRIVKESFGLRLSVLGPIENADLVGLDLTLDIHSYLLPHLEASGEPAPLLRSLVERGELGMKTGSGLRSWSEDDAEAVRRRLFDHLAAAAAERSAA